MLFSIKDKIKTMNTEHLINAWDNKDISEKYEIAHKGQFNVHHPKINDLIKNKKLIIDE